ncbi:MAG: hypothetical protein JWM36_1631 [Hyphomicrobiales bacterium]|nr:hypothetical protein [Hyphomicrobiales bacterium]
MPVAIRFNTIAVSALKLPVPPRIVAAALGLVLLAFAAPATAQNNLALDNLRITLPEGKSTLAIPHIEVTNTNLSREEFARLFSADVPVDEGRALAERMKADRISIPEAVLSSKDARITFGPFLASGIDAGRFQAVSLGGFNGTFSSEKTSEGKVSSGPLELGGGNLAGLLSAARDGDMSGAAVQVSHVSWTGVEVTFADGETPKSAPGGNLYHVKLGSLTNDTTYDGAIPVKSSGAFRSVVVEPPKASKFGKSLDSFGYQRLDLGFSVAASYDQKGRTLTLSDYTLSGAQAGSLGLSGLLGSLDPAIFTAAGPLRLRALVNGDVSRFEAKFVNQGLFEKTLAYFAAQQKKSEAALKAEWSAMATQIFPILLGGDPSALALGQSLQSFIENPRSLTISLKSRGAAVPLGQLQAIKDPATFLALVEVTAKANE